MNRRGFLTAAAGIIAAPAVVKAESIMKIVVPRQEEPFLVIPEAYLKYLDPITPELFQEDLNRLHKRIRSRAPRYPPTVAPGPYLNAWEEAFYQPLPAYWGPGTSIHKDFPPHLTRERRPGIPEQCPEALRPLSGRPLFSRQ